MVHKIEQHRLAVAAKCQHEAISMGRVAFQLLGLPGALKG